MPFLKQLEELIRERATASPETSYTAKLLAEGQLRVRQKVGEEAVEVILACEQGKPALLEESADLLYHFLILLYANGLTLEDVEETLKRRHEKR